MQDFKVNFRKTFLYVLINALLIVGILSIASACNNNNTPQPDGTSSQPDGTSTQPTGTITPIPTPAPYYFLVDLNPVPDLENPGKMAVNFKIRDYYRTNPEKSRIWLEFHWTNIYGSYYEAKRAELVPLNEVLVSGETSWQGDASIYNIVTLSSQIKLSREGVWKIKAIFSSNGEVILTESTKVAVAEGTSVIMYTEEFCSSPLAYLANFSYGEVSEKVIDELHPLGLQFEIRNRLRRRHMEKNTVFETEEYKVALLLRHVDLLITKARRNELEYLEVTPPQMGILHFAQEDSKPCTVLKLRQTMLHSNSSLVAVLNRMEKKGLIQRQSDPRSKKFTRIVVTDKGKEIYKKAMNLSAFNTIISSLSLEDMQCFKQYLNVLKQAADKLLAIK